MAKSMTGFGRGTVSLDGKRLQVQIHSVNSRYCELQIRMPRELLALESALRQQIQESIHRGKLTIEVLYTDSLGEGSRIQVREDLAKQYRDLLEQLGSYLDRPYTVRVNDLLLLPEWLHTEEVPLELDQIRPLLEEAAEQAISQLQAARQEEGNRLQQDLLQRTQTVREGVCALRQRAPQIHREYRERFERRLQERLEGQTLDESRVIQEIALFVDRSDVTEELTRLDSHLQLLEETLVLEGAIGKKLDFVLQEINREVNTTGSKANDASLTRIVVELKNEIEKLREQVQNLE